MGSGHDPFHCFRGSGIPEGGGAWGGVSPLHWRKGLGREFFIFLLKIPYFDAF